MLKMTLIVVGKLKERYLKEAIEDYLLRSRSYADIRIRELKDFGRDAQKELSIDKESKCILNELKQVSGYSVLLDLDGTQKSSEEMAQHLDKLQTRGTSHIIWVIGGSYGVNQEVKQSVNERLSFSKLTFPHGLMRLVFTEQLYRWLSILAGTQYHK